MLNKRVLIISNNALCDASSNGRTLKNFFMSEDRERLAQFFIQSDKPDHSACRSFFRATDGQVLKAFLKRKSAGSVIAEDAAENEVGVKTANKRKTKRNPFTMLVRNFVWSRKGWRKEFYSWVDGFKPEIVLLQAGDCPFLYDISVEISKKYNAPLAIYNSEDYYFKNYNYFRNSGLSGLLYPIFSGILKRSVKKAIGHSALSIYISEDLKLLYDGEFNKNSDFIYTATDVLPCVKDGDEPVFSYLGNLGLNRHLGLIEIAKALNGISGEYKLDVYGRLPNDEVKSAFEGCDAIDYKGLVSYEEVKQVIKRSMLIFHTESFEKFYTKDIAHGFSTKIADSLAGGTCFVLYVPENITCAKYVKENDCALVISEPSELKDRLEEIIEDKEKRNYYINRAITVAERNHSAVKNREKFNELLNGL